MIKDTPSFGRLLAMITFTLSVFGLLMFLWLAFGGPLPLKPQGYRVTADFPEAATLAEESDVRLAGVNVGKVKTKELDKGGARTIVELELDSQYAPIPKDSRAILRQKTLLGETYVEIAPGDKKSGTLQDGGKLPNSQIEPTVELDEIFSSFDEPTRTAFQDWMKELSVVIGKGRSRDLNDAFGNLSGLLGRRRQAAAGARRAGAGGAPPREEHRRGVRRDQRAPGRPAPAGRELQQHVRGDGPDG